MAFIVPTFTPEERAAREDARSADNLAQARTVAIAAAELAMSLQLSGGQYNRAQLDYLLKFCNAVISLIDDGDCMACRENTMFELVCDEDGDPQSDLVPFAKCNAALTGFPGVKA